MDESATPAQQDAVLKLLTGQLGGGFTHLATLIGEVSAIECSPIRVSVDGDSARLSIGAAVEAELRRPGGARLRRRNGHGLRALGVADASAIEGRFQVGA